MKLNVRNSLKLLSLIRKSDFKSIFAKVDTNNDNKMLVGFDVISSLIEAFEPMEAELHDFIATIKGISLDEAEIEPIIPLITELIENNDIASFFTLLKPKK